MSHSSLPLPCQKRRLLPTPRLPLSPPGKHQDEREMVNGVVPPSHRPRKRPRCGRRRGPRPPRPSRHGPTRPRGCPRPAALRASAPPHPPPHGPPRSPPLTPSAVLPPIPTRLSRPCSNVATPSKVLRGSRSPPQTAPVPGCGSSPRTRSGAWAGLSRPGRCGEAGARNAGDARGAHPTGQR
ncbi:basic proline-rich protein-like [Canis lupus dingo]|uniref:basic proline-rich protein-like n=1 Tax=Canis lupus dingo TaxID=286419 RepID=UPI0020C28766|nr:basic proline-rich protein-like [Canis lupus dingo]